MSVLTQDALGRRLQRAREDAGLTQENASKLLGVSRPVLAHIEGGSRQLTGLEAAAMARIYGRSLESLLAEEEPGVETMIASRFRSVTGVEQDPQILETLTDLVDACRQLVWIEKELHQRVAISLPARYELSPPRTTMDAVQQGQMLAGEERFRLGLGQQPIHHLPDLLTHQGIRVIGFDLPRGTSGIFFSHADTGAVIVVNESEAHERRLFSHAHEYCHYLVDRDRGPVVSLHEDKDPVEKRADSFAIHFLAPEAGVRNQLETNPLYQSDEPSGDVVLMTARQFGTSYDAMAFHLVNLRMFPRSSTEYLLAPATKSAAFTRVNALQGNVRRVAETTPLSQWLMAIGLMALRRDIITKEKLEELCDQVAIPRQRLEAALHPKPSLDADFF